VTHLRQLMLYELQRRNYSQSTTRCYLHAAEDFARYFHRLNARTNRQMRTMTEYPTITDGMSPAQIRRWYAHSPSEEKLQLEIVLAHITDENHPHPARIRSSSIPEAGDAEFKPV